MADFRISGRMSVENFKKQFKENFGATLRIYSGNKFADSKATLASIRKGGNKSGEFDVSGNMHVGTFENNVLKNFGIKVQVASSDNSKLVSDKISLSKCAKTVSSDKKNRDNNVGNKTNNTKMIVSYQFDIDDNDEANEFFPELIENIKISLEGCCEIDSINILWRDDNKITPYPGDIKWDINNDTWYGEESRPFLFELKGNVYYDDVFLNCTKKSFLSKYEYMCLAFVLLNKDKEVITMLIDKNDSDGILDINITENPWEQDLKEFLL